jgi:hypothetical protein
LTCTDTVRTVHLMNRRIETMTKKQAAAYRARMRLFHVSPDWLDATLLGRHLGMFGLARALAFVADAIDGGPHS